MDDIECAALRLCWGASRKARSEITAHFEKRTKEIYAESEAA